NHEVLNTFYVAKTIACGTCPMPCEHEVIIPEGPFKGVMTRMEYDSLWAFGPYCGIDQLDAIVKATQLCYYYGLDSRSVGVIVGFVMDCYEKAILTKQDLGEIDAHFGNAEALLALIEKIGKREGIGDVLADGVKFSSEKIGKDSYKLAQQIKGLEVPGYDLRCLKTAALNFATSYSGIENEDYSLCSTCKVDHHEKNIAKHVSDTDELEALVNSLLVCPFSKVVLQKQYFELSKLYSLVTGNAVTPDEIKVAAERIIVLNRIINTREGLTRKDDTLPWKIINDPISDEGPTKGAILNQKELDLLLDDYYKIRGWTANGVPTTTKLTVLDLSEYLSIIENKQEA
ncbi:MAG: hypothetical protein GX638_11615, partial [Crenarchaeota archaeon]|nr:hypothetical protein [Thermoproteota archaeon]